MITIEGTTLVLRPLAFREGDHPAISLPLQRAYVCPNCDVVVHGVIPAEKGADHLVNMNVYATFNQHAYHPPNYKSQYLKLSETQKLQLFTDDFHCGEGRLLDRVMHATSTRCQYVQFYYEPNYRRLLERVITNLSGCEIAGVSLGGRWFDTHAEMLRACQEHLGSDPENIREFLAHFPFGRLVPDETGKGPDAYVLTWRQETYRLHDYYRQVLTTDYECLHEDQNIAA